GRVAALEVMFGVPAIANLIREGKIFQIPSVMQTSRNMGMRLMNDSLLELVKSGQVEPDEALSKSTDKSTLQTLFRQNNISFSAAAGAGWARTRSPWTRARAMRGPACSTAASGRLAKRSA